MSIIKKTITKTGGAILACCIESPPSGPVKKHIIDEFYARLTPTAPATKTLFDFDHKEKQK